MRLAGRCQRGMVTAEAAVAVLALVVVVAGLLQAVALGVAHLRVGDAARAAARELARGGDADRAAAAVAPGVRVESTVNGGWVHVRATVDVPLSWWPGATAEAEAVVAWEGAS